MRDIEALEMMHRCAAEIEGLRREVERLRPKAEAYDLLAVALHYAAPRQGGIHSEDLVYTLKKRIAETQRELELEAAVKAGNVPIGPSDPRADC